VVKKAKILVPESALKVNKKTLHIKKADDITITKDINISISKKKTQIKSADKVEASFPKLKKMIRIALNMSEDELRKLCRDRKISIYGKPSMRNKLACALLENQTNM
jgi:hypothetical protein